MATEIQIKNIPSGYQSIITNGTHTVLGDEPITAKGTNLGMTPTQFLLAGIAMCKVATIRNVARRKNIYIGDVDAQLSQTVKRNKDGSFRTMVQSAIHIDGQISPEQRAMLIEEADRCYVTRVVQGDWEFESSTALK